MALLSSIPKNARPSVFDIHHLAVNSTDSVMRNILDFLPNGVRTPDVKHSR
jgi:hypothetical protein